MNWKLLWRHAFFQQNIQCLQSNTALVHHHLNTSEASNLQHLPLQVLECIKLLKNRIGIPKNLKAFSQVGLAGAKTWLIDVD